MFYVSWWWWCASVARFQQIPLPAPRFFLQRYKSSLKTGPAWPGHVKIARDITHQRQQHIVTFHHLDTIMLLPFVYWKRYLWSRLAPPTNLVNWSKRSDRLFERSLNSMLVTYLSVDFTLVFVYPYFFGGSSADKNSVANSASGGGLGSTSNHQAQVDLDNGWIQWKVDVKTL